MVCLQKKTNLSWVLDDDCRGDNILAKVTVVGSSGDCDGEPDLNKKKSVKKGTTLIRALLYGQPPFKGVW